MLPSVKAYVRFAKFEMRNGDVARARGVYESAVAALGEDAHCEEFFLKFAEFEEKVRAVRCQELHRGRDLFGL